MTMAVSTYIWNLSAMIFGLLGALEYTIKAAQTKDRVEDFACSLTASILGVIGAWNLICLLVKLNVIVP